MSGESLLFYATVVAAWCVSACSSQQLTVCVVPASFRKRTFTTTYDMVAAKTSLVCLSVLVASVGAFVPPPRRVASMRSYLQARIGAAVVEIEPPLTTSTAELQRLWTAANELHGTTEVVPAQPAEPDEELVVGGGFAQRWRSLDDSSEKHLDYRYATSRDDAEEEDNNGYFYL
jgi:hypothetical protein